MKKNAALILAGLIVFTAIYAIYFPKSREPISIVSKVIWNNPNISEEVLSISPPYFATAKALYKFENSEIAEIVYPEEPDLPVDLKWVSPEILDLWMHGDHPVIHVPLGYFEYNGKWHFENDMTDLKKTSDNGWIFNNGKLEINQSNMKIKCSNPSNGIITKIVEDKIFFKIEQENIETQINSFVKNPVYFSSQDANVRIAKIGDYSFKPRPDGRIERIRDNQVTALLDRSFIGMNMAPSVLSSDGKKLLVLLKNLSSSIDNSSWVQIYDKDLIWLADLVKPRGILKPVSICCVNNVLLTAWEDGFISGYSMDGFEIFRKYVADDILDMQTDGQELYILTKSRLIESRMYIRDAQTKIFPRFVYLGRISSKTHFDLLIASSEYPMITLKNKEIKVQKIGKYENGFTARLEADPTPLTKYRNYEFEIIVENCSSKEIVIAYFEPVGKISRLKILQDFAIDVDKGKHFEYKKTNGEIILNASGFEKDSIIMVNRLTSEAVILSP